MMSRPLSRAGVAYLTVLLALVAAFEARLVAIVTRSARVSKRTSHWARHLEDGFRIPHTFWHAFEASAKIPPANNLFHIQFSRRCFDSRRSLEDLSLHCRRC